MLAKPGIIYGNLLTAIGGFLLAARGNVDLKLLGATLLGMALVIGAACVFNNIIDRDIDRKMTRTKGRAMAAGLMPAWHAGLYGILLGVSGIIVLALFVSWLVVLLGLVALFSYVVLYGIAKRHTLHGTLVGTVPGAASVVAGYAAAAGRLDGAALVLFLIMVFWQMPHFYAIAIYRLKDYKAAGIPVFPAKKGIAATKMAMLVYVAAFIVSVLLLAIFGYSSYWTSAVMSILGGVWLYKGFDGYHIKKSEQWARQMFRFSLIVILGFSIMLSLDSVLQ